MHADNEFRVLRRPLRDLLRIESTMDFHTYALDHAISRYRTHRDARGRGLGSVLAIGANRREARAFAAHPFEEILLTGLLDPDAELNEIAGSDARIDYQRQNAEHLTVPSRSFDLVFCKESLHHLPRPVLGLYEMLRVCRSAVIFIEPWGTQLDWLLRRLGLSTVYESNQSGNLQLRDNYVYRWDRRLLASLLNGLYLESGYRVELTLGWTSTRWNGHPSRAVRRFAAYTGWLLGFVPGSRGNLATVLVAPGSDIPPDPDAAPGASDPAAPR